MYNDVLPIRFLVSDVPNKLKKSILCYHTRQQYTISYNYTKEEQNPTSELILLLKSHFGHIETFYKILGFYLIKTFDQGEAFVTNYMLKKPKRHTFHLTFLFFHLATATFKLLICFLPHKRL